MRKRVARKVLSTWGPDGQRRHRGATLHRARVVLGVFSGGRTLAGLDDRWVKTAARIMREAVEGDVVRVRFLSWAHVNPTLRTFPGI